MAQIGDTQLTEWNQRRQVLVRQFDRHEISEDEYNREYNELEEKINARIRMLIDANDAKIRQKREEELERRKATMADEVKAKKEKGVSKPRGPKKDSYASLIIEALQMKSVKNVDSCADRVLEKKPGRDKAKVKAQIVVMINEIKKGKKAGLTWDAENFQLTKAA